ncbi:unnamed protein product [Cyprideis torosa]|uniref:Uncharacterized protein n=1 Tax=Cyprideis torosa TaxID=163714 RepID=A0A7R8W531_9CRUS|nr:unnamed protein product [Cyprideis torosa]CAG0879416.1 unnamed protein product [Cyprideis torosa]
MAWNLSLILEMISPVFKPLFLFFLLASSIAKGLCMVSAQAAWTGIGTNQARKDNLADLNAKFHSQNRGVNFVSTICTLTLIHIIGNHPKMVLSLFVTSMCIHVGINMRVAQVQLYKDLNLLRFQVVYFEWQRSGVFLTPRQANDREPLFPVTDFFGPWVTLGYPIDKFSFSEVSHAIQEAVDKKRDFALLMPELKKAYILLHPNVTSKEKLHAVYEVFQRWYPGPSGSHFELFYTGLASADSIMLVLFETPAGYAVFKLLDEKKLKKSKSLYEDFQTLDQASTVVKLKAFQKFEDTTEALTAATASVEGKISKGLKKILKKLIAEDAHEQLAIADAKLGGVIKEKMNISCVASSAVQELMRGIRMQMDGLISVPKREMTAMSLGLAHRSENGKVRWKRWIDSARLSRYKLKFSPDKVDTMIVQAVSLLDDLDKELNNYIMRAKEWYGWHFPELSKVVTDNIAYIRTVQTIGMRSTIESADLSGVLPEEVEEEVKNVAEISMGTEISDDDLKNILCLCEQLKGKVSRMLAAKAALACRVDALGEEASSELGINHRAKLEARIRQLEGGAMTRLSPCPFRFRFYLFICCFSITDEVGIYPVSKDSTIPTSGAKREAPEGEDEDAPKPKKKKVKIDVDQDGSAIISEVVVGATKEEDEGEGSKKKKKKKKSSVSEEVEVKVEPVEEGTPEEVPTSEKKKKKKKSKGGASSQEEEEEKPVAAEDSAPSSASPVKKKKKKKVKQEEEDTN